MCYLCQVEYGINLVDEVLAHLYTAPPPTLPCAMCHRAKAPHHKFVSPSPCDPTLKLSASGPYGLLGKIQQKPSGSRLNIMPR